MLMIEHAFSYTSFLTLLGLNDLETSDVSDDFSPSKAEQLAEPYLEALAERLTTSSVWLASAESCTGGLVSHYLTNRAGSSAYVAQGWLVYANEAKQQQLGVATDVLATHGAVSWQVAGAMAQGASMCSHLPVRTVGISTTGIAGPGGGSDKKPVGLCYQACYVPASLTPHGEAECHWQAVQLPSTWPRTTLKQGFALAALQLACTALPRDAHFMLK